MYSSTPVPDGPDRETTSESFGRFFETWLCEQEHDLEGLKEAARAYTESTRSQAELTRSINELVGRVMGHYERYYRVKSESAQLDVLAMLTPPWRSSLEEAFLWIGGWRPSTAFHLLYSVSGSQFEAAFSGLMRGLETGDLGDLTPSQLGRVDELQQATVREERELTESLASHQETIADSSMVQLSQIATELTRGPESGSESVINDQVESTLGNKEDKLKDVLGKADDLRLRTLKNVVEILSPIQAAHFLIAAAQLHLRVHEWGVKKDAGLTSQ